MPTVQTMPKAMAPNVARATRVEKVHQPHRNPGPAFGKSDPRQRGPEAKQSQPIVAISPSPQPVVRPTGSGFSVEKALVWLGFLVAVILVLLFGVDLACAWPLGRYTPLAEAVFASCALVLGYLSWDTYRGLR